MSEFHSLDPKEEKEHKPTGSSEGGACLIRHVGKKPCKGQNNSCAYRWQAYLQMQGDAKLYNWNKYESLTKAGASIRTAAATTAKGLFPRWYKLELDPPKENEWDVTGDNFFTTCHKPYWHEAHHIVPNSTLGGAITDCGDELIMIIRIGLLKEQYNLNEKNNMIMLPMDKAVADAIGLPRHRQTAFIRSHQAYSANVKSELGGILAKLVGRMTAPPPHEKPKYQNVKNEIVALSERLYKQIVSSQSGSLDQMPAALFTP